MTVRTATCGCGQLSATCTGDPVRISVCHCLECQKRSGSAFAVQARWPAENVAVTGAYEEWSRVGDSGGGATFRFCPTCGSTVFYLIDGMPDVIAVAVGAFADPTFPSPRISVYEERRHEWVAVLGDDIERFE